MGEFRQRPVMVEAMQYNSGKESIEDNYALLKFLEGHGKRAIYADCMIIQLAYKAMKVIEGDWIVKGPAGDLRVCSPGVFAAAYVVVEEQDG